MPLFPDLKKEGDSSRMLLFQVKRIWPLKFVGLEQKLLGHKKKASQFALQQYSVLHIAVDAVFHTRGNCLVGLK